MDAYEQNTCNNLEFYVQWHFIDSCNLRCLHCYQDDYDHKEIDIKTLDSIFFQLDEAMAKWNMKCYVSFTGGEPFLRPEGLFHLMGLVENSPNFKNMAILTNGTLITPIIAKKIKRYKKLNEVQVSLDGHDKSSHELIRGAGTFSRAAESIRMLKNHGIKTTIMFTLHKKNAASAPHMPALAASLNADSVTVERMTPMTQEEKRDYFIEPGELKQIYTNVFNNAKDVLLNKNTKLSTSKPLWNLIDENCGGFCPIGLSSICILHDGTLLPCRRLNLPLGNILTDGFFKVWYNSDILWSLRKKGDKSDCSVCSRRDRCGGCKAVSYHCNNGELDSKDPQCWM